MTQLNQVWNKRVLFLKYIKFTANKIICLLYQEKFIVFTKTNESSQKDKSVHYKVVITQKIIISWLIIYWEKCFKMVNETIEVIMI